MKMTFLKKAHLIVLVLSLAWVFLMYWPGEVRASIGPFGGNIQGVVVDPNNSNIVYAGTGGGGVFKSTNGGESWSAVNAGLSNLYITALAMDPTKSNIIYAGTGEEAFLRL